MPAAAASLRIDDAPDGARTVRLAGRLDAAGVSALWTQAREAAASARRGLVVDASGVDYCDVAGAALLIDLRRAIHGSVAPVNGLAPEFQAILDQFDRRDVRDTRPVAPRRDLHAWISAAGAWSLRMLGEMKQQIAFVGQAVAALAAAARDPRSVRWKDAILAAERVGVDALPIVALIAFLMGMILAFQSAIPLRQYGGEIFVADLVGLSMLRELGPLMTAILLSGRTGASFAAEIGTMKVNDELNALETMGLDPVRFLVVPRLIAALIMTPLLTIFADMIGLLGGALAMLAFSIPISAYFNEAQQFLDGGDFLSGWVKSFVFGVLIAGIGCMKGIATRNDATAVGESTTDAVVAAIIMIVVVDGIFAYVYYHLGI
jgi:phospholipid/cholesterol/gamma-HCH transport system permease protein